MARLALALLGPLHVTLDDQPVTGFGYDKVRALLAYLAVETRPHRRDALAEFLWPDQAAATARTSLRVALMTLRRAIEDQTSQTPFLLVTRETVQFNPASDVTLDVTAFADLLRESEQHTHLHGVLCPACVAKLTQAVALYRGDLLQQVAVHGSVAYDEWVTLTRERLHHQALEALAKLVGYHETRGEDAQARQYAWRQLALEPWDEAAHRCLMRVLTRSGQRNAALAQYARCCQVLRDELGVDPAAETTALYERIRAGDVARTVGATHSAISHPAEPDDAARHTETPALSVLPAIPHRPNNVPIPPTPLLGRAQEVGVLSAQLRRDGVRLLTLTGPPGVGKTRLGLEMAAALHGTFADGICFVALAPVREPTLVIDTIAHALRVSEASGQPLIDLLKAALGGKALLLLLDNFEHVLDSAPLIADLLATCPQLKILVTSRAALHVRVEHQFPVAPLAPPDPAEFTDVRLAAQTPAVALFVTRAQAVHPSFTLRDENVVQVAEICTRLDGLPLAIELIAARIASLSPAELLRRLDHRLDMLTDGPRDLPAHQQTLRAAIAWSYHLLDSDAQALFRRLGVFVGGWTREAAVAVCADASASGSDESTIVAHTSITDGLTVLCYQSLLHQTAGTNAEPRWTMLETVREYALERLVESGEAQAFQERHAHFFLRLAEAAEPQHAGPQQAAWLDQLETEHDNLRAALRWALDHGVVEVGLRLVGTLGWLWFRHSHLHEGYHWARAVLDMPGASGRTAARAKALWSAGILAWYQYHRWTTTGATHVALARSLLTESVAIWQERGDKRGRAYTQTFLGMVTRSQGDLVAARSFEMESVALFREVGDRWGLTLALLSFANVALWQGDLEAAGRACEESLALSQTMADQWNLAVSLGCVGHVRYSQGDYATACSLYEDALTILREVGDRILIGEVLNSVGQVARSQGDDARAAAVAEEQLALSRELGSKQGIATSLRALGCVAHTQSDYRYLRVSRDEQRGTQLGIVFSDQGRYGEIAESMIDVEGWEKYYLKVAIDYDWVRFSCSRDGVDWLLVGPKLDLGKLADEYAGKLAFTGAFVGMCAQDLSGTRKHADFDYFEYRWPRNRRAVFVMLYAGLRIAEVAELRWGDIDLDRGEIIFRCLCPP